MENLHIEASTNSPLIICNAAENSITIKGESRPENVRSFYEPLFLWIDSYKAHIDTTNKTSIKLNLNLSYFNSSSAKIFLELVSTLNSLDKHNANISFIINWFHDEEDEDMIEAGHEFENMIGITMCFVSKK